MGVRVKKTYVMQGYKEFMIIDRELFKNHQNISNWDEIDNFEAVKIPEDDEECKKVKDSEILELKERRSRITKRTRIVRRDTNISISRHISVDTHRLIYF